MPDPQLAQDSDLLPRPNPVPTPAGIAAALLLAALGFFAAATILHLAMPDPLHLHADIRSEKLLIADRLRNHIDSAAFGSSHVHNGFDPRAFDAALTPAHTRTLNLGIAGGSQAEQRVMALDFLRRLPPPPPGNPCLILLELTAGANFQTEHLVHPRAINVYDLATERFIASLTTPAMPLSQRLGRTAYAVAATGLHYLSIGMLSNRIFSPPADSAMITDETTQDRRGVMLLPYLPREGDKIAQEIASEPRHPTLTPGPIFPGNAALIQQLAAANPAIHPSFVYFIYPQIEDLAQTPDYPDHLTVGTRTVPIINLGRPDRYPAFFHPALWHDDAHFDAQGAQLVSTTFAQQLSTWYQQHGQPPACTTH